MGEFTVSQKHITRACVHVSSEISPVTPQRAIALLELYLREHAAARPLEIAHALVYRVFETDAGPDRLGAWFLLDSLIRAARGHTKVELPQEARQGVAEAVDFLTQHLLPRLVRSRWDETGAPADLAAGYAAIRRGWERALEGSRRHALLEAFRAVREGASPEHTSSGRNPLQPAEHHVDAVWKLRRSAPRPSTAWYVAEAYLGTSDPRDIKDGIAAIAATGVRAHPAVHPTAVQWIKRLHEERPSLRCDMWHISEHRDPCEPSHIKAIKLATPAQARSTLASVGLEELSEHPQDERRVLELLDTVAERIRQQTGFEHLLASFDAVRGATCGTDERASLHLIASYDGVTPSQLLGADGHHAMERVRQLLCTRRRRINEWRALEGARHCLQTSLLGQIDAAAQELRDTVREKKAMLFAPLGLTSWSNPVPPRREDAPVPTRVEDDRLRRSYCDRYDALDADRGRPLRLLAPRLCRICLKAQHSTEHCPMPEPREHWDHKCARAVFARHGLTGVRPEELEEKLLIARQGKGSRSELDMAVAVLMQQRVPYCLRCQVYGHDNRRCQPQLDEALLQENFTRLDAALNPAAVRARAMALGASPSAKRLLDAVAFFARQLRFPEHYQAAFMELALGRHAPVSLVTARYLPEETVAYLRRTQQSHLLAHVQAVREPAFPLPCFFTGRLDRRTEHYQHETYPDSPSMLVAFTAVLHKHCGVTVDELMARSSPKAARVWGQLHEGFLPMDEHAAAGWALLRRRHAEYAAQLAALRSTSAVLAIQPGSMSQVDASQVSLEPTQYAVEAKRPRELGNGYEAHPHGEEPGRFEPYHDGLHDAGLLPEPPLKAARPDHGGYPDDGDVEHV